MTRIIAMVTMLAWALWFGGMIALMIFVIRLFNTSRDVGIATAPILFRSFANYQIAIGLCACGGGTFLCLLTRRNAHAILSLLLIFTLAAAIVVRGWTYEMDAIRLAGQSQNERFQMLHHRSSMLYSTEAILLLIAGVGWMLTFPPPRRAEETDAA
jgi:hypothetical protein